MVAPCRSPELATESYIETIYGVGLPEVNNSVAIDPGCRKSLDTSGFGGRPMDRSDIASVLRVLFLAALAIAVWFVTKYDYAKPAVLGPDAPVEQFSSGRAYATLGRLLGPERPHPVSSDENAAVRARIIAEFAKIGVNARTVTAFTCNVWRGFAYVPCATVTDVIADVLPGQGKAVVLLAHYDSVPAGPGASDDESGVATVLETARALRAHGAKTLHPVLAVITDGEEAGLLGAEAFLENKALSARVGVVVNVEARGTEGRSLLFQTSPGDSALIDIYAHAVPFHATSSLFAEIYKRLPNDTDLTLFLKRGYPAYNFAFSDNVADYHTPLDTRRNLSRLTLQEQGDNMLGLAAVLAQTPFDRLRGHDEVYLDLMGYGVPRLAAAWTAPLAFVALLILLFTAYREKTVGGRTWLRAGLLPLVLIVVCAVLGWLLHGAAQLISGQPDPSYAYPIALREGLTLGMIAAALFFGRMAPARATLFAVWLWFAALALITALLVPGLSPYFLFPALVAAFAALASWTLPERMRLWPFAVPALLALIVWIGLVAAGEGLMGLRLNPLFTVPAAFAAMTLLPFLDAPAMSRSLWTGAVGFVVGAALIATGIAGAQPAYSRTKAQRLSIRYAEDSSTHKAYWVLDANAPLPAALRNAAPFAAEPAPVVEGPFPVTYNAAAPGPLRFPPPSGQVTQIAPLAEGRRISVVLHGSEQTSSLFVVIPKAARLRRAVVRSARLDVPKDFSSDTVLLCDSGDCRDLSLTLDVASRDAFKLTVIEQRFGLPAFAAKLVAARPANAIPSQSGDVTVLAAAIAIPAKDSK